MRRFIVLALVLSACTTSYIPTSNSRDQLTNYVTRAAALVSKSGPSCDAFSGPNWYQGDWYVFVLEPDGKTVCHPARPDLVGQTARDIVDPNGKRIGDAFVTAASSASGSGWVDYVWARPGQTAPVAKSSYVTMVTAPDGKRYIVGSGGYELR